MLVADPEFFMEQALLEAEKAAAVGEVPVGAVVVIQNQIVARAHNRVEEKTDATQHAEMLAIQEASERVGNWRLTNASLFVTLEPCSMCMGAIILARIPELYFGCYDDKMGAVGSLYDLSDTGELPADIDVYPELLAEKSKDLLQEFFSARRREKLAAVLH